MTKKISFMVIKNKIIFLIIKNSSDFEFGT